jgi:DNA (cytosine-5)-methyltransferase 1
MKKSLPIKVFDFFSGCGGTSKGFKEAGLDIVFALDNDPDAVSTFRHNFPEATFIESGIELIQESEVTPIFNNCRSNPILFSGCAPCQPFTKQNTKRSTDKKQRHLLNEFARFVRYFKPDFLFVENVPGLQKVDKDEGPFVDFLQMLNELGYFYKYDIVAAQTYGVPQQRRRLVLIASLLGPIEFPSRTHGPKTTNPEYSSVQQWIKDLPSIKAGETHPSIPNHRAANLSDLNLLRIQSIPQGGSREDWPVELRLTCHSNGYKGHTDVYGRLKWNAPATGLTTRCISLSNGRFGHPEQDRAISIREAASLQTFPRDFIFSGNLNSMARQIGNAVPILLAKQFGENFNHHLLASAIQENGKI